MKQGLPLPARIANAPELAWGLEFTYSSFWQLSTCRPVGWGLGSIPWSSIYEYASINGLEPDETEDFVVLIRKMDETFLKHHAPKKAEKNPKKRKSRDGQQEL